jgi:hypothetical protein
MLQRRAFQQLHHDEIQVLMPTNFVDGADVGMIQRRGSASFAAKTLQRLRIARQFVGQEFHGYKAA